MAADIWEYFEQRRRECRELSLKEEELLCLGEEGSDGCWGQMHGALTLTDKTYLQVSEIVHVEHGHVHRVEYAYYLVHDGAEVWGRERDPSHDPAVHAHGRDHVRYDDEEHQEPISFKQAVEMAWQTVTDEFSDDD
jgi:hypothetical protein